MNTELKTFTFAQGRASLLWDPTLTKIFNNPMFDDWTIKYMTYLIEEHLKEEFIFIDIGAHMGLYSVLCAQLYPQCTVYAFEPSPLNFEILTLNTAKYPKVHRFNCAIHDSSCILPFEYSDVKYEDGNKRIETASFAIDNKNKESSIMIEAKPLTEFGIDFSKVRLVKIDTQYTEDLILKNIWPLLHGDTLVCSETPSEPPLGLLDEHDMLDDFYMLGITNVNKWFQKIDKANWRPNYVPDPGALRVVTK